MLALRAWKQNGKKEGVYGKIFIRIKAFCFVVAKRRRAETHLIIILDFFQSSELNKIS